jgi:hypothetical protein
MTDFHDVPSPDESIGVLHRLLGIWHARDGEASIPLLDGTMTPGMAIHVQAEHIAELTASVITLVHNNIYLSTAPLIRLSLECAVNAVWWASDPDGVRASLHEAGRQGRLLTRAMGRLRPEHTARTDEIDQILNANATFARTEARVFERRCKAIPGGQRLYAYYRLLSEASHGGIPLLGEYSQKVPKTQWNPEGVALIQRPHYRQLEFALGTQIVSFALALAAWDSVLPGHPDEAELYQLADEIGLSPLLREATGRLPTSQE